MDIQRIEFSTYGRKVLEKCSLPRLNIDISKIYYIHDGWIDIKVEDKAYRLEKGHLYLIPNSLAPFVVFKFVGEGKGSFLPH